MPKKIATNADKDHTTISNSVFPCLDNARPANTPPTPTRRLISFLILFSYLHLVFHNNCLLQDPQVYQYSFQ